MVSSLTLSEMERGIGGAFDRELGRNEMGMSRNNFGESFERGMGQYFHCAVGHAPLTVVTTLVSLHCLRSTNLCAYSCRKHPQPGSHELWNGPHGFQHGSHGRDGTDGHGQDGTRV